MFTNGRRFAAAALGVLLATTVQHGSASATIYEYVYSGNVLSDNLGNPLDAPYDQFSGVMWVDESQVPGKTLVSAMFSGQIDQPESWDSIPWLKKFTLFPPPTAFASVDFETDINRNIISWSIDIGDGPPDVYIRTEFDLVYGYFGGDLPEEEDYIYAPPGNWSEPTVVPVPAALLLLLTAIGIIPLSRFASRRAGRNPAA